MDQCRCTQTGYIGAIATCDFPVKLIIWISYEICFTSISHETVTLISLETSFTRNSHAATLLVYRASIQVVQMKGHILCKWRWRLYQNNSKVSSTTTEPISTKFGPKHMLKFVKMKGQIPLQAMKLQSFIYVYYHQQYFLNRVAGIMAFFTWLFKARKFLPRWAMLPIDLLWCVNKTNTTFTDVRCSFSGNTVC